MNLHHVRTLTQQWRHGNPAWGMKPWPSRVKSDLIKLLVRGVMLFLRTSTITC